MQRDSSTEKRVFGSERKEREKKSSTKRTNGKIEMYKRTQDVSKEKDDDEE